jgi:MFS family permease
MAGIIATVTVFAVAQGLTYPLLSFILERQGTTPGLIGVSAAMTPLGFIVSAPFIPSQARRVGGARLAILCSVLAALALGAIGWRQEVWAWMPLRFLLGFFANPLYVISETWLIAITPASRRGRVMGLYSSIVSGGFAVGPLSLGVVGTQGWPPFTIGIAAFLLCGLIVLAVQPPSSRVCCPCSRSMVPRSAAPRSASHRSSPASSQGMPCCRSGSGAWPSSSARRGPCCSVPWPR